VENEEKDGAATGTQNARQKEGHDKAPEHRHALHNERHARRANCSYSLPKLPW